MTAATTARPRAASRPAAPRSGPPRPARRPGRRRAGGARWRRGPPRCRPTCRTTARPRPPRPRNRPPAARRPGAPTPTGPGARAGGAPRARVDPTFGRLRAVASACVTVQDVLGRVGLPAPISELAARRWDAVVVGGGHNGLTAAAYLARAGRSVLVLERREQLGGAATLERPFDDSPEFLISPCAYVVGLLHPLVVSELELDRRGFALTLMDPSPWWPFADGTPPAGGGGRAAPAEEGGAPSPSPG